jgi:hypothetical protein
VDVIREALADKLWITRPDCCLVRGVNIRPNYIRQFRDMHEELGYCHRLAHELHERQIEFQGLGIADALSELLHRRGISFKHMMGQGAV